MKQSEDKMVLVKQEKEAAVKNQDFEKAAKFRDEERKLKEDLVRTKKEWKDSKGKYEPKVTADDIAHILSKWTGIPIVKL
ncbi:MAG: UvrB/UvrC motif-containing protein, partial [Verrucomicrobiota bacterium]